MQKNKKKWSTQEIEELTKKYYPSMYATEIGKMFGFHHHRVYRVAKKLGIEHDEKTIERYKRECAMRIIDLSVESRAKSIRKRKIRYKIDKMRIMSGLRQQTKMRINLVPKHISCAIYHLINRYGYYRDIKIGEFILFYDSQTKRNKNEEYYTKKYGIIFKEA